MKPGDIGAALQPSVRLVFVCCLFLSRASHRSFQSMKSISFLLSRAFERKHWSNVAASMAVFREVLAALEGMLRAGASADGGSLAPSLIANRF